MIGTEAQPTNNQNAKLWSPIIGSGVIMEEVQKDCISKRIREFAMRLYLVVMS